MQIEWVRFDRERYNPHALAAVRQGAREGTLLDVATDQIFIALLLRNLRESLVVEDSEQGLRLEFKPTNRFSDRPVRQPERIRAVETEQSNSTALVDEDYVVKIYRKLENGINPEIEMGRFLTDIVGFANTPALLGSVELVDGDKRSAIGIVHSFVANQGDAWVVTSSYLDRFVDEQRLLAATDHPGESEEQIPYLRYMSQAGRRTAQSLGVAFARCDVSRKSEVDAAVAQAVKEFGRLDILVANAGIVHAAEFLDLEEKDFDRVLAVNLKGVFLVGQAAARQMVKQGGGGAIVNMSSVNAVLAIPNQVPYVVSKGAINQLTKVMSLSLAPKGIRVNGIGPGTILTELAKTAVLGNKEAERKILSRTPMGRMGDPAEVAKVAVFLASDESSYLTGQTIYPDGGRLALNYTVAVPD